MPKGKRVVCGRHAVRAALDAGAVERLQLARGTNGDLAQLARAAGVPVEECGPDRLAQSSGTAKNQGAVAVCRQRAAAGWRSAVAGAANPLILVLDGVEDPRNLGSCLRSAAAFGVDALVHPRRRAVSLTPSARRVASGAEEAVLVDPVTNLARELRAMQEEGLTVAGAVPDAGMSVHELAEAGPLALVLGGEAKGIRPLTRSVCDLLVQIPLPGAEAVASLNVAVACGICLAAVDRSRSGRQDAKRRD